MHRSVGLLIYRLLLPFLFLAAFPGWLVKMLKRGGLKTRLGERAGFYTSPLEWEPCGAVHVHAVSVGETLLALKLIREWRMTEQDRPFVLATGTATGHAVATDANVSGLRVTYAPLDFQCMVRRYLDRFEPAQIVLIEGEVWPHLLLECGRRNIPARLVNARMSPRSARRFRKFADWLKPIFSLLDAVAIQHPGDAETWKMLGIPAERLHDTGSLKFDSVGGAVPTPRGEFRNMLDRFGPKRPVVLAASTHPGEEVPIALAIYQAVPNSLPVIVPRHAERRESVRYDLERAGFDVVLRSDFSENHELGATGLRPYVFVVDTTGELKDWTALADVVIIGKSFLTKGGQNPCEAILAGRPVIFGPHMENFEPLSSDLTAGGGCIVAADFAALPAAILTALDPRKAAEMTATASSMIARHAGATGRIMGLLK